MNKLMTATHWGAYQVSAEGGQVVSLTPFDDDPDPSPIGYGMPQALNDPVRIQQPMVRKAWLDLILCPVVLLEQEFSTIHEETL